MFHHDLAHMGLSPYSTSGNPGTLKWKFVATNCCGEVDSSPAIGSDGTIYVGAGANDLYAINPDGTQKWGFATGDLILSSPAIGPTALSMLALLTATSTQSIPTAPQKWAFLTAPNVQTGNEVWSSPAIGSDATIYVASDDGYLYALTDGGQGIVTQKWAFATGGRVESSPAIGSDGTIYVGDAEYNPNTNSFASHVYAVTLTVTQKWEFPTGSYVDSSPAIGTDGTIYVGSSDDNLIRANRQWHYVTKKWAFPIADVVLFARDRSDGTIYVGSDDGNLYAVIRQWFGHKEMEVRNRCICSLTGDRL